MPSAAKVTANGRSRRAAVFDFADREGPSGDDSDGQQPSDDDDEVDDRDYEEFQQRQRRASHAKASSSDGEEPGERVRRTGSKLAGAQRALHAF